MFTLCYLSTTFIQIILLMPTFINTNVHRLPLLLCAKTEYSVFLGKLHLSMSEKKEAGKKLSALLDDLSR